MASSSETGGGRAPRAPRPLVLQAVRLVSYVAYLGSAILIINFTQLLGVPVWAVSRDGYHAYVDYTKQSFGLLVTTMTQWWSPTPVHVVGDSSVRGLITRTEDGRLETHFGERVVLIANHQIYTDWLYLWWTAYTNRMHGALYIVLKESLRHVPFVGWGMQAYRFIFLSRRWEQDESRLRSALAAIDAEPEWPAWLLVFPEGTNFTQNGVDKSTKYAERAGIVDAPRHMLLPRARGLYTMLRGLRASVPYVYDCTMAYEGVPEGGFGQDYFTLPSIYFQGRPPKSVHMHWRRFAVADIPLDDEAAFDKWLRERWLEKDALLTAYYANGHFDGDVQVDTEVRLRRPAEIVQVYAVALVFAMCVNLACKAWKIMS
ncbi:acyltransferase-domain-containing protein [Dipodascopsis tothii]|uniref:acyltransferase-domain-containing protein n=1 Tax=Dipodascopsis tothii TaxID=44089 RepID=UPI0034CF9000